jgi:hypothetical protein
VSDQCTVLIAPPELLTALKQRVEESDNETEVLGFTDAEALRALDVITKRRPALIVLERRFATTPRGSALINRLKADPALVESEIRVLSPDSDYTRISAKRTAAAGHRPAGGDAASATEVAAPPQALDQRGTRRAPRYKVTEPVEVLVDGNTATLVDVSTVGAQVVTPAVLKPNQRIRMSLPEEDGAIRFKASVAWAKFEIPPKSGPRYRAGVEFLDADATAVDAYCARHKG